MILTKKRIAIITGEGNWEGTAELYSGIVSELGIRRRLMRERCNGDQWARAIQYSHETADGAHRGIDIETGCYVAWPVIDWEAKCE